MNINRNNYEEYFLLYADNELSKTERKVVEIFVQENRDLREEFLMINLTINTPDDEVALPDKSFLLKKEPTFIDEKNCEQIFVLYHDGELSEEQRRQTEQFVQDHPEFKTEFELIQQATLSPDESVVFPDKKQLYRKEKSGKVISMVFWRSAAAAVFVGIGLFAGISYFNNTTGLRAVVLGGKSIKPLSTTEPVLAKEKPADTQTIAVAPAPKPVIKEEAKSQNVNEKPNHNLHQNKEDKNVVAAAKSEIKTEPVEKSVDITPKDNNVMIAANIPVKKTPATIEEVKSPVTAKDIVPHIDKYDESIQPQAQVSNATYAVDKNSSNENYIFYNVKADEFNKSKVGGFLKKVKRIVERTNPITRLLSGENNEVASN